MGSISDFFKGIADFFGYIWEWIKKLWDSFVLIVKKVLSFFTDIVGWVRRVSQQLAKTVSNYWDKIKRKTIRVFVWQHGNKEIKNITKAIKAHVEGKNQIPTHNVSGLFGERKELEMAQKAEKGIMPFIYDQETGEFKAVGSFCANEYDEELRKIMGTSKMIELKGSN